MSDTLYVPTFRKSARLANPRLAVAFNGEETTVSQNVISTGTPRVHRSEPGNPETRYLMILLKVRGRRWASTTAKLAR
jgi:hypothetical protein